MQVSFVQCKLICTMVLFSYAQIAGFSAVEGATSSSLRSATPERFNEQGDWTPLSPFIPGGESLAPHFQAAPGNGATSTWNFTGLANGNYYVAATWYAEPNRTIVANYAVTDGGANYTVNQQSLAKDVAEIVNGRAIGWKQLNTTAITVNDGTLSVTVSDDDLDVGEGGFLIADSIRLSNTPLAPKLSNAVIIDVGQPGHQFLGEGPTGAPGVVRLHGTSQARITMAATMARIISTTRTIFQIVPAHSFQNGRSAD